MSEWIEWDDGICPVEDGVLVDAKYRDGIVKTSLPANLCQISTGYDASKAFWEKDNVANDIVAWRLSEKDASISVETVTDKPLQIVDKIYNVNTVDNVNNPSHYTSHPSGIECIDVTRHMSFNLGNATKYIWRCDLKKDAIEDLRKAIFYLNDEIELRLKLKENV
jgi:hypothetical protein